MLLANNLRIEDILPFLYMGGMTALPFVFILIIGLSIGAVILIRVIAGLVCNIKIFQKMGLPWWKAIIPFYRIILMYSYTMNKLGSTIMVIPPFFWLGFNIIADPIIIIPYVGLFMLAFSSPIILISTTLLFVSLGFLNFAVAKSFGMSTGLCVMSIFLPIVSRFMVAFGKFEYTGNKLNVFNKPDEIPATETEAATATTASAVATTTTATATTSSPVENKTETVVETAETKEAVTEAVEEKVEAVAEAVEAKAEEVAEKAEEVKETVEEKAEAAIEAVEEKVETAAEAAENKAE